MNIWWRLFAHVRCQAPCRSAIQKLLEKFELLGQVSDVKNKTLVRRSRTAKNIAALAENVEENSEAQFHLGSFVNKQNCRIYGSTTPGVTVEKSLDPQHDFFGRRSHWTLLFENKFWATAIVNELCYRDMINVSLWQELDDIDLDNVFCQQDVGACHINNETTDILQQKFPCYILKSYRNYPATSCDLTHSDFFLRGHLKDKVFAKSPASIQGLIRLSRTLDSQLTICVYKISYEGWRRDRDGHFGDDIFHY